MTNGSVVAWGDDWNGQCDLPAALTNAVAIAAGAAHTVVLTGLHPAAADLPAQR